MMFPFRQVCLFAELSVKYLIQWRALLFFHSSSLHPPSSALSYSSYPFLFLITLSLSSLISLLYPLHLCPILNFLILFLPFFSILIPPLHVAYPFLLLFCSPSLFILFLPLRLLFSYPLLVIWPVLFIFSLPNSFYLVSSSFLFSLSTSGLSSLFHLSSPVSFPTHHPSSFWCFLYSHFFFSFFSSPTPLFYVYFTLVL